MTKPRGSHLGRYLYGLRIDRGYETVTEYLRTYELPISEPYYRALESGKKSAAYLTMVTAHRICDALQADKPQFYVHFLKDLLPDHVFSQVIRPIPLESFERLAERQQLLRHDVAVFREAFARARLAASYVASDDFLRLLLQNLAWLPAIHYIYLVEHFGEADLAAILSQNSIATAAADFIRTLIEFKVIEEIADQDAHSPARLRRRSPIFRLPHTELGRQIKEEFMRAEIEKTLRPRWLSTPFAPNGAFVEAGISAYSPDARNRIESRILALLAEMEAATEMGSPTPPPYFCAVILAERPEYLAKTRVSRSTSTSSSEKRRRKAHDD